MSDERESEFAFNTLTGSLAMLVAFCGMGGSGKTESAIRWGTGVAEVNGGPLVVIDTEAGRAMHKHKKFGGNFEFEHINFEAPYSTRRYLSAINYALKNGAGCIIVDSWSHEHDGIGGFLEAAAANLQKLTANGASHDQMSSISYIQPKQDRNAVKQRILQKRVPIGFCFRAKEGTDFKAVNSKGKRTMKSQGIVPIGDLQFFYEMTAAFIFRAGSDGVPDWHPDPVLEPVTRAMAKCPGQFRELLGYSGNAPQVNEKLGAAMARWAKGEKFSG